jgi:hypothetical protein
MKKEGTGVHVNPDFIDSVFTATLDDLEVRLAPGRTDQGNSFYNALKVAALLRALVVSAPLYVQVNRARQLPVVVPIAVGSTWADFPWGKRVPEIYEPFCPPFDKGWEGMRWFPRSIDQYLNNDLTQFVVRDTVTPKEVIELLANGLGGVHLNEHVDASHLKALGMHEALRIGDQQALEFALMTRVGPEILCALTPLRAAVLKRCRPGSMWERIEVEGTVIEDRSRFILMSVEEPHFILDLQPSEAVRAGDRLRVRGRRSGYNVLDVQHLEAA